jgi:hypothetical protein
MPGAGDETWRFEAESEWPPMVGVPEIHGAWAQTSAAPVSCASNARVLDVESKTSGAVAIALPVSKDGTWRVLPRVLRRGGGGAATLELRSRASPEPLATWTWTDAPPGLPSSPSPECLDLGGKEVKLAAAEHPYFVVTVKGRVALDKTTAVYVPNPR